MAATIRIFVILLVLYLLSYQYDPVTTYTGHGVMYFSCCISAHDVSVYSDPDWGCGFNPVLAVFILESVQLRPTIVLLECTLFTFVLLVVVNCYLPISFLPSTISSTISAIGTVFSAQYFPLLSYSLFTPHFIRPSNLIVHILL